MSNAAFVEQGDNYYVINVVTPVTPLGKKKRTWDLNIPIPDDISNDRKEDEAEEAGEALKGLLRYALGLDPGSHYAEIDAEIEAANEEGD